MRYQPPHFTMCMLGTMTLAAALRNDDLLGVARLQAVFVWITFHVARLVEPDCYARMRRKHGWGPLYFHAGNALLHHAPFAISLAISSTSSSPLALSHLGGSCAAFFVWLVWATEGAMFPDDAYVPMARWKWCACYAAGFGGKVAYLRATGGVGG